MVPGQGLMRRPAGILVAGAGPAGLTLALQAHDHGGHVRVVERRPEAFRPSRALIMHARTLEVLRPLGVTEALLARADTAPTVDLRLGRRARRISLGHLELPDTAFPHVSLVRQMDVEEVLIQALADRGVEVDWPIRRLSSSSRVPPMRHAALRPRSCGIFSKPMLKSGAQSSRQRD